MDNLYSLISIISILAAFGGTLFFTNSKAKSARTELEDELGRLKSDSEGVQSEISKLQDLANQYREEANQSKAELEKELAIKQSDLDNLSLQLEKDFELM